VIRRLVADAVPPRVDYMLSDAGKELIPVMEAMCGSADFHLGHANIIRYCNCSFQTVRRDGSGDARPLEFRIETVKDVGIVGWNQGYEIRTPMHPDESRMPPTQP
jgi:hypothetical protein